MDTLVLSTAYQPMRYVDWKEAFCLWFSGRVEVVEFHVDKVIRTVSETLKVPSIVRFVNGVIKRNRQSKSAKFSRINVLLRDNGICQYCRVKLDKRNFTFDQGAVGSSGGVHRAYIFDIKMDAGKNFSDVRSIHYDGAVDGIADVVLDKNPAGANIVS